MRAARSASRRLAAEPNGRLVSELVEAEMLETGLSQEEVAGRGTFQRRSWVDVLRNTSPGKLAAPAEAYAAKEAGLHSGQADRLMYQSHDKKLPQAPSQYRSE